MKLPKFFKLKQAIASLDVNMIAKKIAKLEVTLQQHGQTLDPENTAITQEGIYYIEPESGMATKVLLYQPDHKIPLDKAAKKAQYEAEYTDRETVERFNPYHLIRCNILTQAERDGWKQKYTMLQRNTGKFYYRIVGTAKKGEVKKDEVLHEIENQKLYICRNCHMKVTSILDGSQGTTPETFPLKIFFDVDFARSWMAHEKLAKEKGFLEGIYPKDWLEISRIRKAQVDYHCESCFADLSERALRNYLFVHHSDHIMRKVGYVKLECLCIACLAEHPSYAQLKKLPDYKRYMKYVESLQAVEARPE